MEQEKIQEPEQKEQTKEQVVATPEQGVRTPEQLILEGITLTSTAFNVSQLAQIIILFLKDKHIRDYLDIQKKKEVMKNAKYFE